MTKTEAKAQRLLVKDRDHGQINTESQKHPCGNYEDSTEERKVRSKVELLTDRKQESKENINQAEPSDVRRNTLSLGRQKQKTMVIRL